MDQRLLVKCKFRMAGILLGVVIWVKLKCVFKKRKAMNEAFKFSWLSMVRAGLGKLWKLIDPTIFQTWKILEKEQFFIMSMEEFWIFV